ncbi:MAG: DMT family transporter [Alphaproteobacteria bacterium]|nr:DMT family transporter [Alphaproteobacteria bacterium]
MTVSPAPAAKGGISGNLRGMWLMLAATIVLITQHTLVKFVSADLPTFEILFFRTIIAVLLFLPFTLRSGLTILHTRQFRWHLGRSLLQMVSSVTFFFALAVTPLATVTALHFTAPIFATLVAVFALNEKISTRRWTAIGIGLVGTLVILRPGLAGFSLGAVFVVLSAWAWGVAMVAIRVIGRSDSSLTTTAYMYLLMTPMTFVGALFEWQWPTLEQYGWLVLIGLTGAIAHVLMAESLRLGETHVVTPIDFVRLIWAALFGYLLFGEVPDLFVWIGGAMIFAGTSYIALREHQLNQVKARAGPDGD